jgi:hypothetical protein
MINLGLVYAAEIESGVASLAKWVILAQSGLFKNRAMTIAVARLGWVVKKTAHEHRLY